MADQKKEQSAASKSEHPTENDLRDLPSKAADQSEADAVKGGLRRERAPNTGL